MDNFIELKPKEIKAIKSTLSKLQEIDDWNEPDEDDMNSFLELIEYFETLSDNIKRKVYKITGFDPEKEECEELLE